MKTLRLILTAALAWACGHAGSLRADNVGQWDFNQSNLVQTAGATLGDMSYLDGPTGSTSNLTVFASTTALGIPNIGGAAAQVMEFPGGSTALNGIGYYLPTPPANGGGSLVNDYTYIVDVLYTNGGTFRPLLEMDDGTLDNITAYLALDAKGFINATNTSGAGLASGLFGPITSGVWYRLGFVYDNDDGVLTVYTNGEPIGVVSVGVNLDSPYALIANSALPALCSTITNSVGFVNSIQLRDSVLNPGQMEAIGGPSTNGIPVTVPPGHSYIVSRAPEIGAVGVNPEPTVQAVVNEGSTTINSSTFALSFDGTAVSATVTTTSTNEFIISYSDTNILDPLSVHTVTVSYTDGLQGQKSYSWSFTVSDYQNVTLPAPIYFEDFEEVTEGVTMIGTNATWNLPDGWSVTNNTAIQTPGYDLTDGTSDAWLNWVVVNTNRLEEIASGEDGTYSSPNSGYNYTPVFSAVTGPLRLIIPPIVLNGVLLDSLAHGNCIDADSDQRCNACGTPPQATDLGQVNVLFTRDYDLTGYTNVYVKWNSLYEQNQDNIGSVEYSIDQGVTWLPVLYMLDDGVTDGDGSDVVTNSATGQIDVFATFGTPRNDQAQGLSYSNFIGAVVSTNLIPYIQGRKNDDPLNSKRIEIHRIALADNCAHVRFRFGQAGTSSWYFGMDDFGLYSISLPVITTEPASQTVDANTAVSFTVVASGAPFTYQWEFNGVNIAGATNQTYTIAAVSPTNAGNYTVVVRNASGPVTSSPASLTVLTTPNFTTNPAGEVVDFGDAVTFTSLATGGQPLTYNWYFNGGLVASSSNPDYTISHSETANVGYYQVAAVNSYGAVTSSVAVLKVYAGPLTNSLVVHLTFDGNLNDTSGRGNNATYQYNGASANTSPTFATGILGSAFQVTTLVDSSDYEYATFGYPADLQFGATNDFSVSFWACYTNQSDDIPFISNKDWNSSSDPGWGIFSQSGGNYRINVTGPNEGSDKYSETDTPKTLKDGKWHHVAVSIQHAPYGEGAFIYGYLDGALVSKHTMGVAGTVDTDGLTLTDGQTSAPVPTLIQSTFAVNIGQDGTGVYTDNHSGHMVALLDDFGIWRRAITANEVSAIHTGGQAGKNLSQITTEGVLVFSTIGGNLNLSWAAGSGYKLQETSNLNPADWTDVANTSGTNSLSIPIGSTQAFFRLAQ